MKYGGAYYYKMIEAAKTNLGDISAALLVADAQVKELEEEIQALTHEDRQVKMDAFVAGFKAARANIIAELNKSAKNDVNLFWALVNLEEEDM